MLPRWKWLSTLNNISASFINELTNRLLSKPFIARRSFRLILGMVESRTLQPKTTIARRKSARKR